MARHKTLRVEELGRWSKIGVVERTDDILSDIRSGEKVLGRTVDTGLFGQMTSGTFDRVDYVESVADWEDYLKRRRTRGFIGDEEALERALRRLKAGSDCLRVHTEYQVATYAKTGESRASASF